MKVRRLPESEARAATEVLSEAFYDYPVMRWVLDPVGPEYDVALLRLVGYFVSARYLRDEPMFGLDTGGSLGAVAMVSNPGGPASPPELAEVREAVWAALGSEARSRYEAFGEAFGPHLVRTPHLHLNMIGTRREARGQGLGRALLEHVHRISEEDLASRGVSLTTEDPENVPLYRHFGYEVTGRARVTEGIETWVFFRPDGAPAG